MFCLLSFLQTTVLEFSIDFAIVLSTTVSQDEPPARWDQLSAKITGFRARGHGWQRAARPALTFEKNEYQAINGISRLKAACVLPTDDTNRLPDASSEQAVGNEEDSKEYKMHTHLFSTYGLCSL